MAEDWDCPLQNLYTVVVTMSWSSVQEADQQEKKDLLQEKQENSKQGFGNKTESFEVLESRLWEVGCIPTDAYTFSAFIKFVCAGNSCDFWTPFAQDSWRMQLQSPESHLERCF